MLNITTLISIDPNCILQSVEFKNMLEKIIEKVGTDNETVSSTASYVPPNFSTNPIDYPANKSELLRLFQLPSKETPYNS
jgi:hypothetical protein